MISGSNISSPRPCRLCTSLFLAFLLLLGPHLLAGCGKSGYPRPGDESKNFAWEEVNAVMAGKCIAFTGTFSGEYQYLDGVRMELDIVAGPEDCPGCPFVPEEVTEFSPKDAGFNPKDGTISFVYCPQKAEAYRWRLAGISVFNKLPHATMIDRLLVATD